MAETLSTKELLAAVRRIEIKTRGLSSQLFSGMYHSAFKGRGMSFSEVRAYNYGDDIRAIDWNVTARSGDPYIKVFEEERELTVYLLVDVSKSMGFGFSGESKRSLLAKIAGVLSFSAISNNDKVGVIFFSDKVEKYIPPRKGKQHILQIIRELIKPERKSSETALNKALQFFNNIAKKRAICFILSDFCTDSFEPSLRIAAKRHDVVGIHIYDEFDRNIASLGKVFLSDSESGGYTLFQTKRRKVQDAWNVRFNERLAITRSTFLKARADFMSIDTHASYVRALMQFFCKREGRVGR